MKKRSLVGLLMFCFLSIAVISEASDLFGTIQFKGQPLQDAEITLKGGSQEQHAKTNQRGYYSIRNLEPGNYTMTIQLQDRSTRRVPVYMFPQSTEKNIELK
jgi:hypothetical protein